MAPAGKYRNKLNDQDIYAIQMLIGRTPSDQELDFIAMVNSKKLDLRPYLETQARLDKGAKREGTPGAKLAPISDVQALMLNGRSTAFSKAGKVVHSPDILWRKSIVNGGKPGVGIHELRAKSGTETKNIVRRFRKEIPDKHDMLGGQEQFIVSNSSPEEKEPTTSIDAFSAVAGCIPYPSFAVDPQITLNSDVWLIPFGNEWDDPDTNAKLYKLMQSLGDKPWLHGGIPVDCRGAGTALIELLSQCTVPRGIAIKFRAQKELERLYPQDSSTHVLLIIQHGFQNAFKSLCQASGIALNAEDKIGVINDEPALTVIVRGSTLLTIPLAGFGFPAKSFSHGSTIVPQESNEVLDVEAVKQPKNLSQTFLQVLSYVTEELQHPGQTPIPDRCGLLANDEKGVRCVLAVADNTLFTPLDPRMAGRLTIANAARRVACTGAKPGAVTLRNIFPQIDAKEELWCGMEVLQGQEEAIRALELTVADQIITPDQSRCEQFVAVAGTTRGDLPEMDRHFQQDGDFISILGSHRGELGGSAYLQIIHGQFMGPVPAVDLAMDTRIQEVVLQGIESSLIKSANVVSRGGLAVAVAQCLAYAEDGLGARIHISRKLRNDELLFGETQGQVVISLGEEDIMEFERVCMTIGVPSTTIGRVTDSGRFTFNEVVNVSVREMRKTVEI